MITVKATREGLVGQKTSTGFKIDTATPFVALPSDAALRQWVWVENPANGKRIKALVLDVGPWNEHDAPYVFQDSTMPGAGLPPGEVRPQAESGTDHFGRKTNHAGIDLGEQVWNALGMVDNADVRWEFA